MRYRRLTYLYTGVKQRRAWTARVDQSPLRSPSPLNRTSKLKRKSEKSKKRFVSERWQPFLRRWTWKPLPLRPVAALPPLTRTVGWNPPSSWFSISAIPISEKMRFSNYPRWKFECVWILHLRSFLKFNFLKGKCIKLCCWVCSIDFPPSVAKIVYYLIRFIHEIKLFAKTLCKPRFWKSWILDV